MSNKIIGLPKNDSKTVMISFEGHIAIGSTYKLFNKYHKISAIFVVKKIEGKIALAQTVWIFGESQLINIGDEVENG